MGDGSHTRLATLGSCRTYDEPPAFAPHPRGAGAGLCQVVAGGPGRFAPALSRAAFSMNADTLIPAEPAASRITFNSVGVSRILSRDVR